MLDKLKVLFNSPRFQGVVIIGILQALVLFNIISSAQGEGLIQIAQGIIAAAVAIKTVDKNLGDAAITAAKSASSMTTVSMPSGTSVTASSKKKVATLKGTTDKVGKRS